MHKKKGKNTINKTIKVLPVKRKDHFNAFVFIAVGWTFLVYFNSIFNGFVLNWDDGGYIVLNEVVHKINFENLKIIFTTFDKGNYHPLTTLFYAIEYHFVGDNPILYHVNNLIIHLINVYLVFIFIFRLNKNLLIAFIVSLFFGIHPMHVESVAWISERKDVMYTMFFLLSLLYYQSYFSKKNLKTKYYLLSLSFFFLSLMSKSAAVTLPVIFLLLDFLFKRHLKINLLIEKLPFFALSFLFGIIAILSQDSAGAIQDLTPLFTMLERIMLASYAMLGYIVKMFIPINLSAMYPYPDRTVMGHLPTVFYWAPFIALSLFGLLAWSIKYGRHIVFGFLFYLITIALVLQLLPVGGALMAERYSYVPYIGLFFIVGHLHNELKNKSILMYKTGTAILLIAAILFSYLTFERIKVWKDGETLFTDVINKYPNLPFAYNNRGYLYYRFHENYEKAYADFSKSISINPNFDKAYSNRGVLLYNLNRHEEALVDFSKALELSPSNTDALQGRANTYSSLKQFNNAIPDYTAYLTIKPNEELITLWRGTAYYQSQQYELALTDFNNTLLINPNNDEAYYWRGLVFYQTGNFENATDDLSQAIFLNNKKGELYSWRGLAYYNNKDYQNAISDFTTAIELNSRDAAAYVNRSVAYHDLGNYEQAFTDIKAAGELGYPLDRNYFMKLYSIVEK